MSRVLTQSQPAGVVPSAWRSGRAWGMATLASGLLLGAVILNVMIGAVEATPRQVLAVLLHHLGIGALAGDVPAQLDAVIWVIRLPRVFLAMLVGSALATAGALLQGLFRNPLADPHIIGVSAGASLAAVAPIVFNLASFSLWVLPIAAFTGGLLATAVTYRLARVGARTEVLTLVLAGIAINAVAGAATNLLIYYASDQQLRAVVFWSMGSLGGGTWRAVASALPFIVAGLLLAPRWGRALDLLALGEREAFYLGVPIERLRWQVICVAAILTGASVAVAGAISFVGLVVPHVLRLLCGPSHRTLLPLSAIGGAIIVLLADLVARTVVAPTELPLGVIMGSIGGPFFLWLVRRTRRAQGGWA